MEDDYAAAGRRAVPRGRARAARRHACGAPGRLVGRHVLRPRPRGDLPGVVAEGRLPGRSRLPRLPHVRPPERAEAVAGDRQARATARETAVRPGAGGRGGARGTPTDFVATVVERLRSLRARHGRPGLVVAAYDTELFGHWWHEGPAWLEAVLRALPAAGRAGDDAARRDRGRARRRAGGRCRRRRGVPARTGGCGTASRCRTWCPAGAALQDELLAVPAGAVAGPGARPAGARGVADAVERLGVHGHEGLGGRLRAAAREGARRPVRGAGGLVRPASPHGSRRADGAAGRGRPVRTAGRTGVAES